MLQIVSVSVLILFRKNAYCRAETNHFRFHCVCSPQALPQFEIDTSKTVLGVMVDVLELCEWYACPR